MSEITPPRGTVAYESGTFPYDTGFEVDRAQAVYVGQLIDIAADMIAGIPDGKIGEEPYVSFSNGLAELVRRASGIPEDYAYIVDDAIAWRNA
jgi:hypothetical protein